MSQSRLQQLNGNKITVKNIKMAKKKIIVIRIYKIEYE